MRVFDAEQAALVTGARARATEALAGVSDGDILLALSGASRALTTVIQSPSRILSIMQLGPNYVTIPSPGSVNP